MTFLISFKGIGSFLSSNPWILPTAVAAVSEILPRGIIRAAAKAYVDSTRPKPPLQ